MAQRSPGYLVAVPSADLVYGEYMDYRATSNQLQARVHVLPHRKRPFPLIG